MTITSTNKCAGCNEAITDLYHLIVGSNFYWHLTCLKCSECSCSLQTKCYLSHGKFYCSSDFAKLKQLDANNNSSSSNSEHYHHHQHRMETLGESKLSSGAVHCPTCLLAINANDYVIKLRRDEVALDKASVYHLNCFLCHECHKLIAPGHQYAIVNERIMCSQHYLAHVSMMSRQADSLVTSGGFQGYQYQQNQHYSLSRPPPQSFQSQMSLSQHSSHVLTGDF